MLTKDLLRYRFRADRVLPSFIECKDQELLGLAQVIVDTFSAAAGMELGDIEEQLSDLGLPPSPVKAGLEKLAFDRCEYAEADGTAEELRWKIFAAAEYQRKNGAWPTREACAGAVAQEFGDSLEKLQEKLYADVPEHRKLQSFKKITNEMLLHRFNCAQVQGLLLRSSWITITATGIPITAKRKFFRALKFHQLLALVSDHVDQSDLRISLSGPLSIFQESQTYGMRIANFFPNVLNLPNWELKAELTIDGRKVDLELTDKCGIKSHYDNNSPYFPPEILICLNTFNDSHPGFHAEGGKSFVHLGQQSYCFPDITVTCDDLKTEVHFELFHRWHAGQLEGRLKVLESSNVANLRIGVCRSLARTSEIKSILDQSAFFSTRGFVFRDFPIAEHLWKVLPCS